MKTSIYFTIILFAAAISGCYTVLQHPEVPDQDQMGNVYHQNVNTNDNCYSCHSEKRDQITDYDRYMQYYSNSGSVDEYNINNRWDSYYSVPWWFSPPRVSVGVGSSSGSGTTTTTTKTTSSSTATRPGGSTRSDVKIAAPAATRGTGSSTSTTGSTEKKQESTTTTRTNNNTNQSDSSGRGSSNSNSNDTKRNSGSTRGK